MNKKINTILFILGATVVITVITLVLIMVPVIILGLIMKDAFAQISMIVIPLLLVAAMAGSYFIYSFIIKKINDKIDMNKYFDPLFGKKK